jgi:hypothetical protein
MCGLAHWIKSLRRSAGSAKKKGKSARPHGFRPQLEYLEDRTCMSNLTVTSSADSGAGSLRNTIAAAQSANSLTLASGSVHLSRTIRRFIVRRPCAVQGGIDQ